MKKLIFLPLLLMFAGGGVVGSSRPVASVAPPASRTATRTVSVPKPQTFIADRVIASRTAEIGYANVGLAITHLERAGETTSLSVKLTPDDTFWAPIDDVFDDGETQPIRNSDSNENGYSVDGIYLLDRAHGQKYLVARDPDGRCICDVGLDGRRVSEGSMTLSATYGAPPQDVHAVDVVVPHFGTFANVPLG
jgi:hypothetical protein